MLRYLAIRRLAVIDSAEVEFDPGFNVLSGETGAGKSMLVEAVGLLLGGRASGDLVRTGEDAASIEAIFEAGTEEIVVRREITTQGRSRAFVNGSLTTVAALKELAARLVELHGQHEHQTLLDPSTHLSALDSFAGLEPLRHEVAERYQALQAADLELARLLRALRERESRLELIQFQLAELDKAAARPNEDTELASARTLLTGAERLGRLCEESYGLLYDDDGSALSSLAAVWKRVDELASLDPVFRPFVETRDAIKAQLDDLALQLRRYADSIEVNPARLAQVEERLALLERLKRKHGPSLDDVLARQRSLQAERDELEQGTDRVALQQRVRAEAANAYAERAADLSRQRRLAATGFARSMEQLLADLAMERTRFEVRFEEALPEAEWSADGVDRGEFFLAPNVGEEPRALARIVSGGELSRVMLALKTLIAARRFGLSDDARRPPGTSAPGLVFDEVDAGIGGRVADVVGARLRGLGAAFQVLCITHLPQIAAYADSHFVIEKREEQGRTLTSVRKLDQAGRTEELSRMLGGVTVSAQMRASAEEMLAARRRGAGERTGERAGDRKEPPTNGAKAKGETNAKGESESPTAAKAKTGRQPRRTEA